MSQERLWELEAQVRSLEAELDKAITKKRIKWLKEQLHHARIAKGQMRARMRRAP